MYGSQAEPKKIFGEGLKLDTFFKTMELMAPRAWMLNTALLDMWPADKDRHSWVMPDNFHVDYKIMVDAEQTVNYEGHEIGINMKVQGTTPKGRKLPANFAHSCDSLVVREIGRRCMFNVDDVIRVINALESDAVPTKLSRDDEMVKVLWGHYQESGFLSVRIIEHLSKHNMGMIDPLVVANLVNSLPEKPFRIMTIHDCFRVHPNYGNDLRRQYNQILSDIAGSDMLSYMASTLLGKKIPVKKPDNNLAQKILEANYGLS